MYLEVIYIVALYVSVVCVFVLTCMSENVWGACICMENQNQLCVSFSITLYLTYRVSLSTNLKFQSSCWSSLSTCPGCCCASLCFLWWNYCQPCANQAFTGHWEPDVWSWLLFGKRLATEPPPQLQLLCVLNVMEAMTSSSLLLSKNLF